MNQDMNATTELRQAMVNVFKGWNAELECMACKRDIAIEEVMTHNENHELWVKNFDKLGISQGYSNETLEELK